MASSLSSTTSSPEISSPEIAWAEHDAACSLHAVDREVIHAAEPLRSLILELFDHKAPARDLFNACARLGALLAASDASPSLAAATIDGAILALSNAKASFDSSRVAPARASLLEGFVATLRDLERATSNLTWEYPACAVPLEDGSVAIACGYPTDDAEALAAWAARLARRLSKENIKRVVLAGSDAAKGEVASAVDLVGIEARMPETTRQTTRQTGDLHMVAEPDAAKTGQKTSQPPEKKSWLRLPWRK